MYKYLIKEPNLVVFEAGQPVRLEVGAEYECENPLSHRGRAELISGPDDKKTLEVATPVPVEEKATPAPAKKTLSRKGPAK